MDRDVKFHYRSALFRLPLLRHYSAITLGRHVFVKGAEAPPRLVRHELKHVEQVRRLGVTRFYFLYLWEYARNLAKYRSHRLAYHHISFEVEAREAEGSLTEGGEGGGWG